MHSIFSGMYRKQAGLSQLIHHLFSPISYLKWNKFTIKKK